MEKLMCVSKGQPAVLRDATLDEYSVISSSRAQAILDKPMMDWKLSMKGTDSGMPRFAEDILDGMADKSGVAQITLDRLQSKKELRATKP